jgi:hypothetical protein
VKVASTVKKPKGEDLNARKQAGTFPRDVEEGLVVKAAPEPAWSPASPVTIRASDVVVRDVEWLWPDFYALGQIGLIAGSPGDGKSTVLRALTAAVTTGAPLPLKDGTWSERTTPRNVIMLLAEDSIDKIVVPHLKKLGANLDLVTFMLGRGNPDDPTTLGLGAFDLKAIETTIDDNGAVLLIIDPWTAYTGGADTNKSSDVRKILVPLSKMAQQRNVAVVLLLHVNKRQGIDGYNRVSGSGDLYAQARHVVLAGRDPKDVGGRKGKGVLIVDKNNTGPRGHAIGYEIVPDAGDPRKLPFFEWTGASTTTTAELLATDEGTRRQGASKLERAHQILQELLEDGPCLTNTVRAAMEEAGISVSTEGRARGELGIKAYSEKDEAGKVKSHWLKLPDQSLNGSATPSVSGDEGLAGKNGTLWPAGSKPVPQPRKLEGLVEDPDEEGRDEH